MRFSALQRAEIAEIIWNGWMDSLLHRFSALQRAEIAEIGMGGWTRSCTRPVSVLFNEPKLLKYHHAHADSDGNSGFSALQRAEIAEI